MNQALRTYDEFKPKRKPIELAAELVRKGGRLNVEAANCIKRLHDQGKPLLNSLCWALCQLQGDSGTGDSHWSQFPEYVLAVEVVRSLGGDVAHSSPVSVCDHYRHKALQAVIDWDGQDTVDLFAEILKATGEDTEWTSSTTT